MVEYIDWPCPQLCESIRSNGLIDKFTAMVLFMPTYGQAHLLLLTHHIYCFIHGVNPYAVWTYSASEDLRLCPVVIAPSTRNPNYDLGCSEVYPSHR